MPAPLIFGGLALVAGAAGVVKGIKGISDSAEADDVQKQAEQMITVANKNLEKAREKANNKITNLGKLKLDVWSTDIREFVDLFSQIHNINLTEGKGLEELRSIGFTENTIASMKSTSISAQSILGSGLAGVGAGALLGWGTYGGVMALGTTATTGAAIGSLGGIAAQNATLAWLGGGALSVGGGGMALGSAVLGGIVAGPALLIAGGIFESKAKEKLNNAYSNLAEASMIAGKLEFACDELDVISKNTKQIHGLIEKLSSIQKASNKKMRDVINLEKDWNKMSVSDQDIVIAGMKTVQLLKCVVDAPLLGDDGLLTREIMEISSDKSIQNVIGIKSNNILEIGTLEEKYEYVKQQFYNGDFADIVPELKNMALIYPDCFAMLYYIYSDGCKGIEANSNIAKGYATRGYERKSAISAILYALFCFEYDSEERKNIFIVLTKQFVNIIIIFTADNFTVFLRKKNLIVHIYCS